MEGIPSLWERQSGSDDDGDTGDVERLSTAATSISASADNLDTPTQASEESDDQSKDGDDDIRKGATGDDSDGHEIVRFNVTTNFKPSAEDPTGRIYNIDEKEVTLGWEPKNDDIRLDGVRFWALNPTLDKVALKDDVPSASIKEFLFNTDKDGWGDEYNDPNAPLTHGESITRHLLVVETRKEWTWTNHGLFSTYSIQRWRHAELLTVQSR